MTNQERFETIWNQRVSRDGAQEMLEYLRRSDFFTAPASTQYHLSRPGGLCEHSLHVYDRLVKLYANEFGDLTPEQTESLTIIALLHDLCKVNFYKQGTRNVKDENGKWQTVTCYTICDTLPYGHGEKSVYMASAFLKLTRDEAMAIRWHMGAFGDEAKGGSRALSPAMEKYPLIVFLHAADLMAAYIDEVNE